jgi:RimJ/RimL family protein N-acetyltransferase
MDFFDELRAQHQFGVWIITDRTDGRFMGHSILAYRETFDEPELGYALGKQFWGKGFATEAARAIVRYGFERANLSRIFGIVFQENEPSWGVLRKLGFTCEQDVIHYGLPLAYYALNQDQFVEV